MPKRVIKGGAHLHSFAAFEPHTCGRDSNVVTTELITRLAQNHEKKFFFRRSFHPFAIMFILVIEAPISNLMKVFLCLTLVHPLQNF